MAAKPKGGRRSDRQRRVDVRLDGHGVVIVDQYHSTMALPRWLARFNRSVTNRVVSRLPCRRLPFVNVHHVGRRSGRQYTTPLMAFRTETGFVFALTYGPGADWVRNVLSAEWFEMETAGRRYRLIGGRLVPRREALSYLPNVVGRVLRLLGVRWFLAADLE